METILFWTQGKTHSGSILSRDGEQIMKDNEQYDNLYRKLVSIPDKTDIREGNFAFSEKKNHNQKEFYIYSNFNEVDEANRLVGYMAYIIADSFEKAWEKLEIEAKIYGYTCREKDKIRIEEHKKKVAGNVLKVGLTIGGIIILSIIILKIFKN